MAIGSKGENLIFLISQPRAGSTLLQRIIAGHPLVFTTAEPWLMLHPIYGIKKDGVVAEEYNSEWAYTALNDFLLNHTYGEKAYFDAIHQFAQTLYNQALRNKKEIFFLDKTPRYYLIIPELFQIFPKAKFIFLIRNPLAVLFSILNTWVEQRGWTYLCNYKFDLLQAPLRLLEGIKYLGDQAHLVHYEKLVKNPRETVSSICTYLGLDFHDSLLYFDDFLGNIGCMGDVYSKQHQFPVTTSLNKWLHLGDSEQTRHFALSYLDNLGNDVIEEMGYSYQTLKNTLGEQNVKLSLAVIPWRIAIEPKKNWSIHDRKIVNRAKSIQLLGSSYSLVSYYKSSLHTFVKKKISVFMEKNLKK